jgi:signal transduction histidine kinase
MPTRRAPSPSAWWRALAEWRNWRLPVKVGAVLTVPVIAAVALGVVQIRSELTSATAYSSTQRMVSLRGALVPLIAGLQQERTMSLEHLTNVVQVDSAAFQRQNAVVDKAARSMADIANGLPEQGSLVDGRRQALTQRLADLSSLRKDTLAGTGQVADVQSDYNVVVSGVLDFDQALSTRFSDPELAGTATALSDIEQAREQVRLQQTIVLAAVARGQLPDTDLSAIQASEARLQDRLDDFQVVITPQQAAGYHRWMINAAFDNRAALTQDAITVGLEEMAGIANTRQSFSVPVDDWNHSVDGVSADLSTVADNLIGDLVRSSAALQDQAGNRAGQQSVILFAILLAAITVGVVIGRHLLRSLGVLRRTALDVAEVRLPATVASVEEGGMPDLAVQPMPVHTSEELGQLARAFDAVHGQAVRSAAAQAHLRDNLRNIFMNLSRRCQSLVERQLRLMEQLERDEQNPEQLANLFKLDHLATRMRRNNENLMVLSGGYAERRTGPPLPIADVVRAAVSEIEQYERVVVRSTPTADVLGYAAGDLVRLIAELLDNATSFSPPDSQVYVDGKRIADGSIQLDILDTGIGMRGPELEEAMRRVASAATVDVPVSRQMGLFVVGRLARRHAIDVSLTALPDQGGLRGSVRVPAELVTSNPPGPSMPDVPVLDSPAVEASRTVSLDEPARQMNGGAGDGPDEWRPFRGSTIADLATSWLDPVPAAEPDIAEPNLAQPNLAQSELVQSGFARSDLAPSDLTQSDVAWPDFPEPNGEPARFGWFTEPTQSLSGSRTSRLQSLASSARGAGNDAWIDVPTVTDNPQTSVGLPRRVPRPHVLPESATPPAANPAGSGARRRPERARGFLNDYQAGIRQNDNGRSPEPADNGHGQEDR